MKSLLHKVCIDKKIILLLIILVALLYHLYVKKGEDCECLS